MTTIKPVLNYRHDKDGRHTLLLQVIHNRHRGVIFSKYRMLPEEFDTKKGIAVALTRSRINIARSREINNFISTQINELSQVISRLEATGKPFISSDITTAYRHRCDSRYIHTYVQNLILKLNSEGRYGTALTYGSTLVAFEKFVGDCKFRFDDLNSAKLHDFVVYLKRNLLKRNTIAFYLRVFQTIYKKAKHEHIVVCSDNPFDSISVREDKTRKLAIGEDVLRKIVNAKDLSPQMNFARDLFIFSFNARGMSFVDIAFLRREQLTDSTLHYKRHKTGQPFSIRMTPAMREIIARYNNGLWVFPLMIDAENQPLEALIGESEIDFSYRLHRCYKRALSRYSQHLDALSVELGLECKLSFNVARHSWASLARNRGIPVAIISGGLGHTSEKTTNIYLDELDTRKLDEANDIITKL